MSYPLTNLQRNLANICARIDKIDTGLVELKKMADKFDNLGNETISVKELLQFLDYTNISTMGLQNRLRYPQEESETIGTFLPRLGDAGQETELTEPCLPKLRTQLPHIDKKNGCY